ncbi:MAG TPA: T9SS type A sorting domain-containing protein [Bacteroidia bacterium]|nr:T9SS type A sorting domain-containing protein [Bacteroidia bacterium]
MTNICVVFSCEHYIDSTPRGSNNYLGHWLNGTDTTYWANNPHYLRDAFVEFEEQYKDSTNIPFNGWGSIKINNYQWFTYGRVPLNELREGDRAADYIDMYCSNQQRMMEAQYESNAEKDEVVKSDGIQNVTVYPNPAHELIYITSSEPIETILIFDNTNRLITSIYAPNIDNGISIDRLNSGTYTLQIILTYGNMFYLPFIKQ